ncbi:CHAD domain-containing protein [Ginsengibacter hankyongi]|uniref:CHAD domain-containing protein n=1 Tax=Ginsengibacter hankyongi TaxID=2607284 RepID=A0A5J5IJ56_9BACT|nr:CHAD domain-containing protein [Ginsengibacter hankyongi]KAA9041105.1 CHAD domain-containing protein [Ginsengibacter hankyongi]
MKNDEIQPVIKQHFKIIDKLFHRIIIDFDVDDILEFRVEIKKLRSFLHLVNMQFTNGYEFRITKKLKTFYGYAGIIRNLQLHLKNIRSFCDEVTVSIPESYLTKIDREIQYWKVNAKSFMNSDNNFYNDEEIMLSELPDKITKSSIKKLLQYTFYELNVLVKHQDDDEVLHSIRKFLQDVAYNLPAIHYFSISVPEALGQEKNILSCIEQLEIFRDKCIDLVLLKTYYDDSFTVDEKKFLQKIEHQWQKEKQELKIKIYSCLKTLQLTQGNISSFMLNEQYID